LGQCLRTLQVSALEMKKREKEDGVDVVDVVMAEGYGGRSIQRKNGMNDIKQT